MEPHAFNDKALWSAASSGDANAFGRLFEIYFPKLFLFAFRYTHDHSQAEDAVQQVFLRCWEKRADLSHVENIVPYLHRCIKNELIDLIRKKVLQTKYEKEVIMVGRGEEPSGTPVAELALRADREEILSAALNHLPPQQKRVYTLSKEKGWSYTKIAQEMEVSTHTVKWHAAAAFQSLSLFLKRHEKELFMFIFLLPIFF